MPTARYKGRHVKPASSFGSIPRGPKRWARAYDNAMRNPNSHAADLLFTRIENARRARDLWSGTPGGPMEHSDISNPTRFIQTRKRRYLTCSFFCTAMQVQLDHGLKTSYELDQWFCTQSELRGVAVNNLTIKRDVRCQCCGTIIPKRAGA